MSFICQQCNFLMKTPGAGMTCLRCSAPSLLSDDDIKAVFEYIRRMGLAPRSENAPLESLTEWIMLYGR